MPVYLVTEDVTMSRERSEDGRVSAHTIRLKLSSVLRAENEEAARDALSEKRYPGFSVDNAQLKPLPETPEINALLVDMPYENTFGEEMEPA